MMRKRIAAWALTACMALTLLPLHAGAVPISGPVRHGDRSADAGDGGSGGEHPSMRYRRRSSRSTPCKKWGTTGKIWCCCCWATATRKISSSNFFRRRGYSLAAWWRWSRTARLAHRINVYAVPAVSNEAGLSNENNKLDTYFGLTTLFETKSIGFRSDTDGEARVNAIRADLERLCLDEGAFVDNIHMFINTDADVGSASGIYSFSTGGAKDYAMAHELSHSVGKLGTSTA